MNIRFIISAVILLHICAFSAYAASTLTLTSSGAGVFMLQGDGMEDVAALNITITYDSATLSSPQVSQEDLITGAMMAVNPNTAGLLRIAVITTNPIRGHGNIAKVTFSQTGNAAGGITALRAAISNINGSPLPVVAQVNSQTSTAASASGSSSNQGSSSTTTDTIIAVPASPNTGGNRTVIGGVETPPVETVIPEKQEPPTEIEPGAEKVKEAPTVAAELSSKEVITSQDEQGPSKVKTVYTQKSVLDRFRELKGERSPKVLTALFNHESLTGFKQEPPVILSDERSAVKVIFIASAYGKKIPEVSVEGARLISLTKDPDKTNTWIGKIQPDKGVNSAALTVMQDRVTMIFPITVASKSKIRLGRAGKLPEADFNKFLKERGSLSKPKYDLNSDGKRDYVDDYIFTAHYLLSIAKVKKVNKR